MEEKMMCDANGRNHDAVISPTFKDGFWQSAVFGGHRNHEIIDERKDVHITLLIVMTSF